MKNIEIKKVASANEAIAIINRLNYMGCTFEYEGTHYWSNDRNIKGRHFETDKSFVFVELVKDDKLVAVRFYNLYRDITVELQFGDITLGEEFYDKFNVINVDAEIEIANNNNVETITKEEPKMTIETKIAKNGAQIYYVDGKRTSREIALDAAAENRKGNLFTVETGYWNEGAKTVNYKTLMIIAECPIKIQQQTFSHDIGFRVIVSSVEVKTFYANKNNTDDIKKARRNAAVLATKIAYAYIIGAYGIRILGGYDIKILDAPITEADINDYAVSTEAQDAAIEAEIELANVEVQPKRTRKLYTFNAPQYTEDDPVVFNRVDIRIDGNRLTIDGIFRCQNVETAYRRFQKCMSQAAAEIPQLEGWDNWLDAKKLTQLDSGEWINENEDIIFGADCVYTIAVDTNEDLHYIYGNFTNAFTSESATLSREDETPANNEPNLETKSASDANEAITILKSLEPKNHLRYEYICDAQVGEITYRHFASIDTKCGATPYRLIEVVINGLLESVMLIDTAHGNAGTKITFDRTANNNPPAQKPADDEPPADNFTEMRSKLHAAVKSCQADVDRLQNELAAANDNLLDAEKNLQDFLDAQANQLTSDLHAVIADKTIRYYRAGAYGTSSTTAEGTNIYIDAYTSGFDFTYIGKRLATYETPAQVKAVIARIKETIERGESEFTFPTADELNPPTAQTVTEQLAEINSTAPEGMEIFYDAGTKKYPVVWDEEICCTLDSLTLYSLLPHKEFWERMKFGDVDDETRYYRLEKLLALKCGERDSEAARENPDQDFIAWLDLEIADLEGEMATLDFKPDDVG